MANTIASTAYRRKYASKKLQHVLRSNVVAEAISKVERGNARTIENPYGANPTVTQQTTAGTYTPADFTLTDDTLTVNQEFIVSEHFMDFEEVLSEYNLFKSRLEEMSYAVAEKIDAYVISTYDTNAGESLTISGGFTSANVISNLGAILGKLSGYAQAYKGIYLVIADTDVSAFVQAQVANGFNYADRAIKNGLVGNYMTIDIHVVRSAQFPTNKRIAGVKGMNTYAIAEGRIKYEEKAVSGKTGMEVAVFAYCGAKVWNNWANLTISINVA